MSRWAQPLALVLTLALMVGFYGYTRSYATPADAEPYHQNVAEAINAVPMQFDGWVGRDVEVPPSAIQMLKPNAILSRQYFNASIGAHVTLLIVHCKTARDLGAHYPPVCYPSGGWSAGGEEPEAVQWDRDYRFKRYHFSQQRGTSTSAIWVWNILLLPDGGFTTDIASVGKAAEGYLTHFFGAGQVQLVFDAGVPAGRQGEVVQQFGQVLSPVMRSIASGLPAAAE